ncbi:adenine methyltransferase [Escherichia phage vB-Eco-KMB41]|nr:adenine methyltransferase [Escherichia phage vB-Eco-KMB41]
MKDEKDTSTIDHVDGMTEAERAAADVTTVSGRRFNKTTTPDAIRQKWQTPRWLFDWAAKRFGQFGIDVAAEKENALCDVYLDEKTDALKDGVEWGAEGGLAWCNPPYAEPLPWIVKAIQQAKDRDVTTVFLLNSDASTAWFKKALDAASLVIHITSDGENSGRVAFVKAGTGVAGKKNSKPSVMFVIKPKKRGAIKTEYLTQAEMMFDGKSMI